MLTHSQISFWGRVSHTLDSCTTGVSDIDLELLLFPLYLQVLGYKYASPALLYFQFVIFVWGLLFPKIQYN